MADFQDMAWLESAARAQAAADETSERMIINMGPQHPSTHGVLRIVL